MIQNHPYFSSTPTLIPILESESFPRFVAETKLQQLAFSAGKVYGTMILCWRDVAQSPDTQSDYKLCKQELVRIFRRFKQEQDILFVPKQSSLGLLMQRNRVPEIHMAMRDLRHQIAMGKFYDADRRLKMVYQTLGLQVGWALGDPATQGTEVLCLAEMRAHTDQTFI